MPADGQFARLAAFAPVPFATAAKTYKLARFTEDIDFEDMFGEPPAHAYVAKGTVKAARVKLDTVQDAGVYIIDGDLVVDGALDFTHLDGAAVLCVLGSVKAKSLRITGEAHLWVAKDLTLAGPLVNELSDAGGLHVRGKTKSVEPAAAKPAKARTKPHPGITAVAPLAPIALDAADEAFGLRGLLDTARYDPPKALYLHRGDVTARGVVDLREPAPDGKDAVYIIDGDLEVDTLAIAAAAMSTWGILVVTGSVRARRLSCLDDGRLWVGKDLDVVDVAIASNKLHVSGAARIPLLVIRTMPPAFATQPAIGTLVDFEAGPVDDWATRWHATLPERVAQKDALAPAHAGASVDALVDAMVAGAALT